MQRVELGLCERAAQFERSVLRFYVGHMFVPAQTHAATEIDVLRFDQNPDDGSSGIVCKLHGAAGPGGELPGFLAESFAVWDRCAVGGRPRWVVCS